MSGYQVALAVHAVLGGGMWLWILASNHPRARITREGMRHSG